MTNDRQVYIRAASVLLTSSVADMGGSPLYPAGPKVLDADKGVG